MTKRSRTRGWSFLAAAASLLATMGAAHHGFVTIDLPGVTDIEAYGIDNHGNVTGLYYDADGNTHGFVYQDGVVTTVDAPTSNPPLSQAQLYNINNKGKVGAYYVDDNGIARGAVYDLGDQTWSTLPVINIPAYFAGAGGVNANGIVAGNWTRDPTGLIGEQGWTFDPKTDSYSFFDVPGVDKVDYFGTVVSSINNAGVVVGYYTDSDGGIHGFTKTGTQYRTIDVPGVHNTVLYGINNQGDVAGRYRVGDTRHGFVLRNNGKMVTIDVPGAINTWVTAISENGNIAGFYQSADGNYHAFFNLKGGG
jgi:probable HAF family extracellular repeat protein